MTKTMILRRRNENPSNNLVTQRSWQNIDAWIVNQKLHVWTDEFPFHQDYDSHFDSIFLTNTMSGAVAATLVFRFSKFFSENSLDCVYPLHLFQIYLSSSWRVRMVTRATGSGSSFRVRARILENTGAPSRGQGLLQVGDAGAGPLQGPGPDLDPDLGDQDPGEQDAVRPLLRKQSFSWSLM